MRVRAPLSQEVSEEMKFPLRNAPQQGQSDTPESNMIYAETGSFGLTELNKNIMLYWDTRPYPADVLEIVQKWRDSFPDWNVTIFDREMASIFLSKMYGREIVRLFLTCALPAMRADFFRVFWAISEGGIYSDLRFTPRQNPIFFNTEKDLTVPMVPRIPILRNNLFFAKRNCKELKLVACELIKNVSQKKIHDIYEATGPTLWGKVIPLKDTSTVSLVNWKNVVDKFVYRREYPSSTRGTDMHWTQMQLKINIYHAPPVE